MKFGAKPRFLLKIIDRVFALTARPASMIGSPEYQMSTAEKKRNILSPYKSKRKGRVENARTDPAPFYTHPAHSNRLVIIEGNIGKYFESDWLYFIFLRRWKDHFSKGSVHFYELRIIRRTKFRKSFLGKVLFQSPQVRSPTPAVDTGSEIQHLPQGGQSRCGNRYVSGGDGLLLS